MSENNELAQNELKRAPDAHATNDGAEASAKRIFASTIDHSIMVLAGSVSAYIFAHFWLKSYLQHFNFDEPLVYVDLQTIVLAGGALLASITSIWLIFSKFPTLLLKRFFGLLIAYQASWLPFLIFLGMQSYIGFTWLSVSVGVIAAIMLAIETSILIARFRSERGLFAALDSFILTAADRSAGTLESTIDRTFGTQPVTILLLLFLAPYLLGSIAGERFADRKRDFLLFTIDQRLYVVVWAQGDSVFASEVSLSTDRTEGTLTKNVRILQAEKMQESELEYLQSIKVSRPELSHKRVSFEEFWSQNISTWW